MSGESSSSISIFMFDRQGVYGLTDSWGRFFFLRFLAGVGPNDGDGDGSIDIEFVEGTCNVDSFPLVSDKFILKSGNKKQRVMEESCESQKR